MRSAISVAEIKVCNLALAAVGAVSMLGADACCAAAVVDRRLTARKQKIFIANLPVE
jgi:hypothetical protein